VLQDEIVWEQHAITLYGRTMPTPRLTAWIGDSAYCYSGILNQPAPWPEALAELRDRLRRELTIDFNSCLANLYRDGTDSMGYRACCRMRVLVVSVGWSREHGSWPRSSVRCGAIKCF
jgi:alkylated DNA repair dioxygenase AlkB